MKKIRCSNCNTVFQRVSGSDERCPNCDSTEQGYTAAVPLVASPQTLASAQFIPPPTTAGLLLQAVFDPGDSTKEGQLIRAVAPAWFEIVKILLRDPNAAYKIPPRKWEEIIAAAYYADGYEVTLTPASGDHGRDVIAVKRGFGCIRIIDQVKAYKPGNLVTANDVRALLGVLNGDQQASKGIVTTTSDFAPKIQEDPFIARFIPFRLELVNGEQLLRRLQELAKS